MLMYRGHLYRMLKTAMGPISFSRLSKVKDPSEILEHYDKDDVIAQYKYDGWKMMASHDPDGVKLYSRRGKEVQENFPSLVEELDTALPIGAAVLGEITAIDPDGVQSISAVQSIAGSGVDRALEKTDELYESGGHLTYYVYDLLELDGKIIAEKPMRERDALLRENLKTSELVQIPENFTFDEYPEALEDALSVGGEGLVFKPLDEPYLYGKVGDHEKVGNYIKYKPGAKAHVDEVFVDSYRMGKAKAIFPAYQWDENGEAVEVGKLSGLPRDIEKDVMERIDDGETVVVEVTFQERMPSGKLRHMGWSRLRPDKPLDSVTVDGEDGLDRKKESEKKEARTADFPSHPDTVMIPKNDLNGGDIIEEDVWNYYDGVKDKIVEQTAGRLTTLMVKVDGTVVQRNRQGNPIEIDTTEDFDRYNNGRTLEFHPEIAFEDEDGNWLTDVLFCDLDPQDEFPWRDVKDLAVRVHDRLLEEDDIESVTIKYSGGRGFHVLGHLTGTIDPNEARTRMKEILEPFETDKIKLGIVREDDMLRLDTTLMKKRGSLRGMWSLASKTGLVAVPVPIDELPRFEKQQARIGQIGKFMRTSAVNQHRIENQELDIVEDRPDHFAVDDATELAEQYPDHVFTVSENSVPYLKVWFDSQVGSLRFEDVEPTTASVLYRGHLYRPV